MKTRLTNKIALITGGNSGIGRETARRFIEEGALVAITGRSQVTIDQTVAELGPDKVVGFRSDAASPDEMAAVLKAVHDRWGRLDILFLNAGVAPLTPLGATSEALYDEVFDINVKGVFFAVQAAVPYFGPDGGSIVITSSTVNSKGMAPMSAYSATKAAVRSLARSFSAALLERKIRVNTVSPGPIETPIFGRMGLPPEQVEGMADSIKKSTPAGRFGTPLEIADCVVYLASDESRYVIGADIPVDGGFAQI